MTTGVAIHVLYGLTIVSGAAIVFRIANYAGVRSRTGMAIVVARRTVPRHREFTGKTVVTVPEYETLDLIIEGQELSYCPVPWILERVAAGSTEPVEFSVGRFNKKIQIRRFKYL